MPPFLSCKPVPQQILLALPSDYVQNLTTSHHLHCDPAVQVSVAWNTYMILHLQSLLLYLPTTVWRPHRVLDRSCQNIVISCPSSFQISPVTSHLTETNPSPFYGFLRPYMTCFPSTSQASSSATIPLLALLLPYRAPWCSYQTPSCPKAFHSLQPPWHLPFPTYPHGSPSHISGPCLKVTSLKRSSMTTLSKVATPSNTLSLFILFMPLIITWHITDLSMAFHHHCYHPPETEAS